MSKILVRYKTYINKIIKERKCENAIRLFSLVYEI